MFSGGREGEKNTFSPQFEEQPSKSKWNYCEKSLLMLRITTVMGSQALTHTHPLPARHEELAENKTKFDRNLVFLDFSSFRWKSDACADCNRPRSLLRRARVFEAAINIKIYYQFQLLCKCCDGKFCSAETLSRNFAFGSREISREIGAEKLHMAAAWPLRCNREENSNRFMNFQQINPESVKAEPRPCSIMDVPEFHDTVSVVMRT